MKASNTTSEITLQDVKDIITNFGLHNYVDGTTVLEVINGEIEIKNDDDFKDNQLNLIECVFVGYNTREFNDDIIESNLSCLNVMVEQSKTHDLLELLKEG